MIHKLHQHILSLNTRHCLGLDLFLHENPTHVFTKKLLFRLLHNHALDLFLIWKGYIGNNISPFLLLVSIVLLSHFFYHILLFLKQDRHNDNELPTLDCQPAPPIYRLSPLPLPQRFGLHILHNGLLEYVTREARLMVKSGEVAIVKTVLFEEDEDVVEETRE
jgi:hypothetical protein